MIFKGEVPFVRLLIPLILGIIIAHNFAYDFIYFEGIILLFFLAILYVVLLALYKKHRLFRWRWVFGFIIHCFIALLSYCLTVHYSGNFDKTNFSSLSSEFLFIKIISEPKLTEGIVRFEGEASAVSSGKNIKNSSGKLLLAIKLDSLENNNFQYGDLLLVPSSYKEISPSYNPGEFDYKSYLQNKQVYFQIFLESSKIKKIAKETANPIIYFALSLRKKLVEKYIKYIPDKEASSLASTLILGYRADLNKDLIEAYSKTGTMHVLSVSGMHVGIVFLVLSFLLKSMNKNRQLILIRAILIIGLIWFYSLLTGFSSSVCRSALMLSFVVLGKAINKNQNSYNLMAISAFFLLLYDPFYLFDVGFQLSYLAVAGLVYFHPLIYNSFYIKNKILDSIWSYTALSLAAQLATFPISLYYFHQFPVYFLISNLLIVFPVAIIMYAGIVFLFIPFEILNKLLGAFLNWLIIFTNDILYKIEELPFSAMEGLWINTFELLLICLLIVSFIFWQNFKKKNIFWITILACFVLLISFTYKSIENFTRHELVFFSLRNNIVIGYLNRGNGFIFSDLDFENKYFYYSIKPYFSIRGVDSVQSLTLAKHFQTKTFLFMSECMQFGNFKVLRWKNEFNDLALSNKIDVNIVLVPNLKNIDLRKIQKQVKFNTLIFESNIPDFKIKKCLEEAKQLKINYISLHKNPAYIVKL